MIIIRTNKNFEKIRLTINRKGEEIKKNKKEYAINLTFGIT